MKTATIRRLTTRRLNFFLLLGVFILAVAALAVPFRSAHSKAPGDARNGSKATTSSHAPRASVSTWAPMFAGETIAVYASDCVTPKLSFNLGETVCAKTDGVDLTVPGNYYINWTGPNGITNGATITQNPQEFLFSLPTVNTEVGLWKPNIARVAPPESSIIGSPPNFTVSEGPAIATFAPDCTTPKTAFVLGDTVCARITGEPLPDSNTDTPVQRHFNWVNSASLLASSTDVITDPQTNTFTLSMNASARGSWSVNAADNNGDTHVGTAFSVSDPAALSANLTVNVANAETVSANSDLFFTVRVANRGPDSAASVQLTDVQPLNTTFVSVTQTDGEAAFSCTGTSTVTCSASSMAKGDAVLLVIVYNVNGGTSNGTIISNTLNVTSSTTELYGPDNTFEATSIVDSGTTPTPSCVLDCPDNITVTANTTESSVVGAHVTFENADPIGDCGAITTSVPSGSFFPVGTTVVSVTSGTNGGSCSFNVIVTQAPLTINCPADQTVTAATGDTTANVNPGTPTTNPTTGVTVTGLRSDDDDDPDTAPLSLTAPYSIGVTYISWTVRETSTGRTATCTQRITVNAAGRPNLTISCPANQTVAAPSGSCQATVNVGTPTTNPSDNDVVVTSARSDGRPLSDPYPAGATTITWTATDGVNGQVATCTHSITVTTDTGDTTPPTFTSVPGHVSTTTSSCGQIVGETELGTPEATDTGNNCAPGTVTISRTGVPAGNFFPTGTTTIIYTATDAAGNSSTATQTVTVNENPNTNPTITAPQDLTVNTGPGATTCGVFIGDATLGSATANDNCAGVTVARSGVPAGNNFPVGTTTITYTATDRVGNTAIDTQVVTVIDNTPPVITLNQPGQNPQYVECHTSYTELGATATDNCPTSPFAATPSGTVNVNTPGTYTITYNATDSNGNAAVPVTRTVIVRDTIAPTITLNSFAPSMWPPNHKYTTFQLTQFVTGATDSCQTSLGLTNVVIEKVTSDELENSGGDGNTLDDIIIAANCKSVQLRSERDGGGNGRVYTITFKVTDASGNVGRATAKVKVPHNNGSSAVEDAVQYTVNGSCP